MSAPLLRLLALFLLVISSAARADYLEELVAAARAGALATQREWLDLGHYRPNRLGRGHTSLVVTPEFFNAAQGRHDPAAELDATLAAFFDPSPDPLTGQPRQCRFIARYQWLKEKLRFDPARLPQQRCDRFDAWYDAIDPHEVTLVFPAAYINNPSSMFGHTLLRIDNGSSSGDTRLFSYALNFAAASDETNGVVFALRGLFGGYYGNFSTIPYYEKVKEYNDLENRDIWEYELNLTPAEIRRLLEHAWEMGQINFDYYFFSDNCSYQLLALLDVARPGRNLVDRFPAWAIPSDTVRVTLEEKGFLRASTYRPSNQTRLQHARTLLTPHERRLARAAIDTADGAALNDVPDGRKALVVDTAYDYLQYRYLDDDGMTRDRMARQSMTLLRQRSRTPPADPVAPVPVPPVRPDEGHATARLALGAWSRAGDDYLELRLRPAYHDLIDPPAGYTDGAQINFLDIRARWQREAERLELESFRLVEIVSLTPRDEFFSPLSWQINAGVKRLPLTDMASPDLMPVVSGGAGLAYRAGARSVFYLMANGLLAVHDDLPHDYTLGFGPEAGFLLQRDRGAVRVTARAYRQTGLEAWFAEYAIEGSYALDKDLALRLSVQRAQLDDEGATDTLLGLHLYF